MTHLDTTKDNRPGVGHLACGVSVREMAGLVHPSSACRKYLAVFRAFLDESGSYPDTRVFALAGYMGTEAEWTVLESEWSAVLTSAGLEPGEPFHMADFEARQGPFKDWSNDQRIAVICGLVDTVLRRDLFGHAAGCLLKDYDELVTPDIRPYFPSPYLLCFEPCVREFAGIVSRLEHGKVPTKETVAFICDAQVEFEGQALRRYGELKRHARWLDRERLGSITFESKRNFVPLQVADLLAYETFKHLDNSLYSDRAVRKSLQRLMSNRPSEGRYYDRLAITKIVEKIREAVGW